MGSSGGIGRLKVKAHESRMETNKLLQITRHGIEIAIEWKQAIV